MRIPKTIFGIDTREALERYLEESKKKPEKKEETTPSQPQQMIIPTLTTPADYLHLKPIAHGKHEYGDLYVHLHRLGVTSDVTQICQRLNYTIEATVAENNGHIYVGKLNHPQAMTLIKELQKCPLNLRRYVDFLKELREGFLGRKILRDAAGNDIHPRRLSEVYGEITEVRNPWRSEWLNDRYSTNKKKMRVAYEFVNAQGMLEEVTEALDPYLTQNKTPGIDLNDWLDRATVQGLPPEDVASGSLYYWPPVKDRVVRFDADADGAFLICDRDPQSSGAAIGVRLSAAGAQKI